MMKDGIRSRLTDSCENALKIANGNMLLTVINSDGSEKTRSYSQNFSCEEHNFSMPEISPRMFSFNNPLGAGE